MSRWNPVIWVRFLFWLAVCFFLLVGSLIVGMLNWRMSMPMFHFRCAACSEPKSRLLKNDTISPGPCAKCGGKLKREAKGATTRAVEKLDNGAMPRAIERLSDIENLRKEYVASDPQLKRNSR